MMPEEEEEKLILFAVLQDIANELRRIKRERQEMDLKFTWRRSDYDQRQVQEEQSQKHNET